VSDATETLYIDQGVTFTVAWSCYYPGTGLNTTWGARSDIRNKAGGTRQLRAATAAGQDGSIALTAGGTDTVTVTLTYPAAATATLAAGRWVYDVQLFSGAVVLEPVSGAIICNAQVTTVA
jgi:hypothetical protein